MQNLQRKGVLKLILISLIFDKSMRLLCIKARYFLALSLCLVGSLGIANAPSAFAQDNGAAQDVNDDTPVVPDNEFPSILALDSGNSVWTLKLAQSNLKVNGDVVVNSTNKGAIWMADSSLETKGKVSVAGGVSRLGKVSINPDATLGGRVMNDPLPDFRIPPPGNVMSAQKLFVTADPDGDDVTLPPGIYNGGIFANGKGHITLRPGTFVITNGDFDAIGPTIEGEGVTIVMAGDKPGALNFSLGARFKASAPTSGKLKDLLFISRAAGNLARGISFAQAQGDMQGLLYAPNSSVLVLSQSQVRVSKVIAYNVDVTGSRMEVTGSTKGNAADNGNQQ